MVYIPADERDGSGPTLRSIGKWPSCPTSCCGCITAPLFHFADIAVSSRRYWLFLLLEKTDKFFIYCVHLCRTGVGLGVLGYSVFSVQV